VPLKLNSRADEPKAGQFVLPVNVPAPNADALFEQAQAAEDVAITEADAFGLERATTRYTRLALGTLPLDPSQAVRHGREIEAAVLAVKGR
jgi:hypothetical protein